jgi:beta-glucosidase
VKQVVAANPRTVVVLLSSFPYAINWTQEHAPAILHMAHNSEEEGNALADVLFGDYNPAGRLAHTWPQSIEQLPPMMDYDIRHGRTYLYFSGMPLYPFGYGLSYTAFAYSNLRIRSNRRQITVDVDVRNTGTRDGDEVVQLYIRHENSKIQRPQEELKAFARVALKSGEQRTVPLVLKIPDLAYWDEKEGKFVVEPDRVTFLVGASSSDVRLRGSLQISK